MSFVRYVIMASEDSTKMSASGNAVFDVLWRNICKIFDQVEIIRLCFVCLLYSWRIDYVLHSPFGLLCLSIRYEIFPFMFFSIIVFVWGVLRQHINIVNTDNQE